MRISDWSSDVCSSDLAAVARAIGEPDADRRRLRDAEGNLESKRGDLERDRMPGKLRLADPAHQEGGAGEQSRDRKRVVQGKSVSVRVELGGSRVITKKSRTQREQRRLEQKYRA